MNLVPYSETFEQAVIVAALTDPNLLPKLQSIVAPDDFYLYKHKEIFEIITSIEVDNLDSLAVEDKIKDESTLSYFKELVQSGEKSLPSITNVFYYAQEVADKAKLRAGIDLGREIQAACFQPNVATSDALRSLEDMFARFLERRVLDNQNDSTIEAYKRFIEKLGKDVDDGTGTYTGFRDLDLMLHRLEGLTILAARPSVGKTALAINIARNVAEQHNVLFFSLEQSRDQIFERMLASESNVSLEEIRTGAFLNDEDTSAKVLQTHKDLYPVLSRIDIDEAANIDTVYITSAARQKKFEKKELGLIVIDYLHIMRLNEGAKVDTLGMAVKELRDLSKELETPVLLLAQLNREVESNDRKRNRRPTLANLRGSGEIEQNADIVMFLYRDSYYDDTGIAPTEDVAEAIVAKNRQGRTGTVLLEWYPEYVKFEDLRR